MQPLFERVVVVDWSASSRPKRGADSIWIGVRDGRGTSVENLPTRAEARERVDELCRTDLTTLVGFDFAFGYPADSAAAMQLAGVPWCAMWSHLAAELDDDDRNRNNRFAVAGALNARVPGGAGPFWGRPAGRDVADLTVTKPAPLVEEWRHVDLALGDTGRRPFSVWQLLGIGSVGSQTLTGVPVVHELLARRDGRGHVWPFTTGLRSPEPAPGETVFVEVWPSMLDLEPAPDRIRDAVQVETVARLFYDVDRLGRLAEWFEPEVDDETRAAVESEEGWVLGVRGGRGAEGQPGEG